MVVVVATTVKEVAQASVIAPPRGSSVERTISEWNEDADGVDVAGTGARGTNGLRGNYATFLRI